MTSMQNIRLKAHKLIIQTPDVASILIVDDERFDRARLRRMCDQLEFTVIITEAVSLESMGTALGVDTFDLIFLDYHLPDGSGLQALDAIQFDPRNRHAATIMVTGDDESEIAINAMKNGCSDFLMKDDLSIESVRRAAINALQKASLNKNLEVQAVMRSEVELVIDRFANECAIEIKPMLVKMVRHVRDLHSARTDEERFSTAVDKITKTCDRLFDFMNDVEDHERKSSALSCLASEPEMLGEVDDQGTPDTKKGKLFSRYSSKDLSK